MGEAKTTSWSFENSETGLVRPLTRTRDLPGAEWSDAGTSVS